VQSLELAIKAQVDSRADGLELPPLPKKAGRKYLGSKQDLRVRVDKNLYELLLDHARAEFGGNASAALDAVLWTFYNRPQLSFETAKPAYKTTEENYTKLGQAQRTEQQLKEQWEHYTKLGHEKKDKAVEPVVVKTGVIPPKSLLDQFKK
jgi:hypothetical protein